MAHGLETLLDAAAQLQLQNSNDSLSACRRRRGKRTHQIPGTIPRTRPTSLSSISSRARRFPAFISASDACLVLLKKTDVFKTVIPTKMLEFMSCARPVILGVDGQARQIIEDAEAGLVIEPENSEALVGRYQPAFRRSRILASKLGAKGKGIHPAAFFSRPDGREIYRGTSKTLA